MGANIFVIVPCFHDMGFYGTFTANVHLNDLNGSFTNERVLWNRTTCGVLAFFCQIGKHLLVKSITCNMTWFSGDIWINRCCHFYVFIGVSHSNPHLHAYSDFFSAYKYKLMQMIHLPRVSTYYFSCADIFSWGEICLWTRCEISGFDHIPYCCTCYNFLHLCSQKNDGWFFLSLGDINNDCCCRIHSLCEFFSLFHWYFILILEVSPM